MSELINERICDNCKRPFGDHFWPSLGGRCTQNPAGTKFIPIAEPSPEPEAAPEGGAARKVVRFAYLPIGARFRCGRAGTVVFQKTDEDHAVSLEHPGSDPFNFELSHPCYVVEAAAPASEAQPGTSALYVTKAAYDVRLAELAQLRARVAILDAQEAKLPELDVTECDLAKAIGWMAGAYAPSGGTLQAFAEYLACRERQLLDAQRAIQAFRGVAQSLTHGVLDFRDQVLNQRNQLEEGTLDNDQTNAVLGAFDDTVGAAIAAYDALAGKDGE